MTIYRLHLPEVSAHTVRFSWEVEPASELYWKNDFFLSFPHSIDLAPVPARIWSLIAMLCLHPHWLLLRPCRVELPFVPEPGEIELWSRLLDAAVATLENHAGRTGFARSIEFECHGSPFPLSPPLAASERCATAFSGGKDSLVQTGLLTELTRKPVLVATTSPGPPREDHLTERRKNIFSAIGKRRDLTFVEVESDFRATVNNDFSHAVAGYATSATELTDTFLYFSSLLAVSAALGVTHLFLAAEAEVQESVEREGRTIQHRHFMYSAVTQKAISSLIAPHGMQCCSLTSPLYASQVHRLLWTRFPDLRDLQYSCWRVRRDEDMCSQCRECLGYAMSLLAMRERPARIGLDLGKVMRDVRDWQPRTVEPGNLTPTPSQLASRTNSAHFMTNARAATLASFLWAMLRDHPREMISARGWEAFQCFRALKQRLLPLTDAAMPGYRPGFLELIDPLLRERAGAIFEQHFDAEPEGHYAAVLERSDKLAGWICEPVEPAAHLAEAAAPSL